MPCAADGLGHRPARAADTYVWIGGTGGYDETAGWYRTADALLYDVPPDDGSQAVIGKDGYVVGDTNETVSYNTDYSLGLAELDIDAGNTLKQATGHTMISTVESIGIDGVGTYSQSSGTNKVTSLLSIGNGSSGSGEGVYNLASGTLNLTGGANAFVGYSDSGQFNQTGGTALISGNLYLADFSGTNGTYTMNTSNGPSSLSVTGSEFIGLYATGSFTQSSGTNTTGALIIADNSGSSGYYELDTGNLNPTNLTINAGGTYNQFGGTLSFSTFNQNGGTSFLGTGFNVANKTASLSSGTMTVVGAISLSSGGVFHQSGGSLSFLTFNQTGGTANFDTGLSGDPSYTLSGGSLTASSITSGCRA